MYLQKEPVRGYNVYIDADRDDLGTQMDVGLLVLEPGDKWSCAEPRKETAVLLFSGRVQLRWGAECITAERADMFRAEAWCLLAPRGTDIELCAETRAELYIQKTINERDYPAVLYRPQDVLVQHAGASGELQGCMRREIKTFFDYSNAPFSNMVLGEVLNLPGRWSSYPPHHHPQPEVYFHRFDRPEGFGASFANGEVYRSGNNGLTVINRGFHSQAAAPGFAMCYVWGIRHLDGDPWEKTRIDDPGYEWLWQPDANEHIYTPDGGENP